MLKEKKARCGDRKTPGPWWSGWPTWWVPGQWVILSQFFKGKECPREETTVLSSSHVHRYTHTHDCMPTHVSTCLYTHEHKHVHTYTNALEMKWYWQSSGIPNLKSIWSWAYFSCGRVCQYSPNCPRTHPVRRPGCLQIHRDPPAFNPHC